MSRTGKRVFCGAAIVGRIVAIWMSLSYTLFGGWFPLSCEEIYRLPSPDGKVDAVLVELDAGATTTWFYRLYIVQRGGHPPKNSKKDADDEVLAADDIKGFGLTWMTNGVLEIVYDKARILHFRNIVTVGDYRFPPWQVTEIRLAPRTPPPSTIDSDRWDGMGTPPSYQHDAIDCLRTTMGKTPKAEQSAAPAAAGAASAKH